MHTPPADALPQREAAKQVAKSLDTIRRWRRHGHIQGWDVDGRVLVSLAEVVRVAGLQQQGHPAAPVQTHATVHSRALMEAQVRINEMERRVRELQADVADARAEREAWREMAQQVGLLIDGMRAELVAKDERLRALEGKEGEVRGLLGAKELAMDLLAESERRVVELEMELRVRH
jgi:transposase